MSSLYDSPLTVYQTITPEGPVWRYTFAFENTDSGALWHLNLYTEWSPDPVDGTPLAVEGRSTSWYMSWLDVNAVYPEYDPRNIVPGIEAVTDTWVSDWDTAPRGWSVNALKPLETGYGFSFIAGYYDPTPKFYCYETELVYAPEDGSVCAYGWTQAAPGLPAFVLVGAAPLVGGLVRRFRRK